MSRGGEAASSYAPALEFLGRVESRFQADGKTYSAFMGLLQSLKLAQLTRSQMVMKVKGLFHGHDDLIEAFFTFLPKGTHQTGQAAAPSGSSGYEDGDAEPLHRDQRLGSSGKEDGALRLVQAIKERSTKVYEEFIEILENVKVNNLKTKSEVYAKVSMCLRDHEDLLNEFKVFLPKERKVALGSPRARPRMLTLSQAGKRSPATPPAALVRRGPVMLSPRAEPPPSKRRRTQQQHREKADRRQKYKSQPMAEVISDLREECHAITPSYSVLPSDYLDLRASGRGLLPPAICEVFNDVFVSALPEALDLEEEEDHNEDDSEASNSSDVSEETTIKELLWNCEDEQTDLDVELQRARSLQKLLQEQAAAINRMTAAERKAYQLPSGLLRGYHYALMSRLYEAEGPRFWGLLQAAPYRTIPTVLNALQNKVASWHTSHTRLRSDWVRLHKQLEGLRLRERSLSPPPAPQRKQLQPERLRARLPSPHPVPAPPPAASRPAADAAAALRSPVQPRAGMSLPACSAARHSQAPRLTRAGHSLAAQGTGTAHVDVVDLTLGAST